jgi:hypothetical protein
MLENRLQWTVHHLRACSAPLAGRATRWALGRAEAYGVDARILVALYVASAIPFYAGILLMISGSGLGSLGFRELLSFEYRQLDFSSHAVVAGLVLNRLAWAMPYLYIELRGRRLRWYFHAGVWFWILSATLYVLA